MSTLSSQSFKNAFFISIIYFIAGVFWIVLSDFIVAVLSDNAHEVTTLQIYKGWFFVFVTTVILFLLSYKIFHVIHSRYTQSLKQIKKYIQEYKLNTGHFKGKAWNRGLKGIGKPIIPLAKILKRNSLFQSFKLKKDTKINRTHVIFDVYKCDEKALAKARAFLNLQKPKFN